MERLGIITFYGTNNAGTFLQCFATEHFLESLGYRGELIQQKNALVPRLNSKIRRVAISLLKSIRYPKETQYLRQATSRMHEVIKKSNRAASRYLHCEQKHLNVVKLTPWELKRAAYSNRYVAFLSGSDQIWNPTQFALITRYFLRFAPIEKRIAFAPSFGVSEIPLYNKNVLAKFIGEYKALSVRESDGVRMIQDLTGKDALLLPDPVFLIDGHEWHRIAKTHSSIDIPSGQYALLYFLNAPSEAAISCIRAAQQDGCRLIEFQYAYNLSGIEKDSLLDVDPFDFICLIANAEVVMTDSFHATVFSTLLHRPFWAFDRQYGHKFGQSSRVKSFLNRVALNNFFNTTVISGNYQKYKWDFDTADAIRQKDEAATKHYLLTALINGKDC